MAFYNWANLREFDENRRIFEGLYRIKLLLEKELKKF